MSGREFFTTRTVAEALAGFRPAHRTAVENVPLSAALHRVPAADILSPHALPGFAKSTVDGFAVRAADTYGASDGLPSYLDLLGAVQMGTAPTVAVKPGGCVAMPTGGVIPEGADAVVMVEYTAETMPGTIEVTRPVAPGGGIVRADDDVAAGAALVRGGRPLRAPDLGLLAAAGVTSVPVHAKPRVTIISTGDEVVPPGTAELSAGQVRDATASALAGLAIEAGGEPVVAGIVSDEPGALKDKLTEVLPQSDLVVVSAGSSVGARDETAGAVAAVGSVWCHGLAIKPGKPTLLAECGRGSSGRGSSGRGSSGRGSSGRGSSGRGSSVGVPLIGLPGNPLSALVVFGQIGIPLLWRIGGCPVPPARPNVRARLSRDLASAAGRLDVIQVKVIDGVAEPLFGPSALLSVLTRADGYVIIPEPATGLDAGIDVDVTLYP